MRKSLGLYLLAGLVSMPSLATVGSNLIPFSFFAQSKRRDANQTETDQVVRAAGCTAFFVENTAGKTFLATARHCFGLAATAWCRAGNQFTDNDGNKGACVRMAVGDTQHDIVIFEADFKYSPRETIRLSAKVPADDVALKMIGYPCDKYRNCKLTTTEQCWILKTGLASPHSSAMGDQSGLHNCTTYGGNSGGPMLLDRTNIAVGLPFTYFPNDYTVYPSKDLSTAAYIALMADFVSTHRKALESEGIVLED